MKEHQDEYWVIAKQIHDPETGYILYEENNGDTDNLRYAGVMIGCYQDLEQDPNITYELKHIPEPHPLRWSRRRELGIPIHKPVFKF